METDFTSYCLVDSIDNASFILAKLRDWCAMDYHLFKGFKIPVSMIRKTGRGPESWDSISASHLKQIKRYVGIKHNDNVLELGCGVGRDAIPILELLGADGTYLGIDVMSDAINWCRENICKRFPNSQFEYIDIRTEDYNPEGKLSTVDIELPADDSSVDKVILQSVFTHLMPDELSHYFGEFSRVLRSGGLMFSTFFIVDKHTRELLPDTGRLTFSHPLPDGAGAVNDLKNPRRAVAYEESWVTAVAEKTGLKLRGTVNYGTWSGRRENGHGQDVLIFERHGS